MTEDDRSYPVRPIVGVGVVVWRDNRVLLVKRGRPPRMGQWALPGGAQELGETLFEAALREVREEAGILIAPHSILTALDLIERDADGVRYHYTLVQIDAGYVSGEIEAGDDASDAGWFAPDEISGLDAWEQVEKMVRLSRFAWKNISQKSLKPSLPRKRESNIIKSVQVVIENPGFPLLRE